MEIQLRSGNDRCVKLVITCQNRNACYDGVVLSFIIWQDNVEESIEFIFPLADSTRTQDSRIKLVLH